MAKLGLRALVTRPREEAKSLIAALAIRALEALVEPLMEIHWRTPETFDLDGVQAILCTSANGVRALARVSGERRAPLFAVGDATAALRAPKVSTMLRAPRGTSAISPAWQRHGCGRKRDCCCMWQETSLQAILSACCAHKDLPSRDVFSTEARAAVALSPAAVDSLRAGDIAFALFFSPRTAAIFARLADVAGVTECCAKVIALSISVGADAALAKPAVASEAHSRAP